MKLPSLSDKQFIGVFAIITVILSIISFMGMGFLDGFFAEEGTFMFDFFVFDEPVSAIFSPFSFINLNPIRRYIHMIVPASLLALLIIGIEKLPFLGDLFRGHTISPKLLSGLTTIIVFVQVFPAIFIEEHIFFSNPTWLSDWIMNSSENEVNPGHNGYMLFTVVYSLSIFSGLMHLIFLWSREPRTQTSKGRNALVSFFIIILSIVSFTGIFQWDGFLGGLSLDDFLLTESNESPFGGIVAFFAGPMRHYIHWISLPGLYGVVMIIYFFFKRLSGKVKNERPMDLSGVSKYSILALFVMVIQIFPIAAFGYDPDSFFRSSPTWLSDVLMGNYGYPAFTLLYFVSVTMGMIRAITGSFFIGKFEVKKNYRN